MVSVVIPAYNEENTISDCLKALVRQTTQIPFEVIVVDNNSTDKTQKLAIRFQQKLNLRIIKELKKGRGAARARGFKEAKGNVILSTDADTQVPPTWVEEMVKFFQDDRIVAVTGTWHINDQSSFQNQLYSRCYPLFMHIYRVFSGYLWLSGFNFAIRNDIYRKAGGFNPNLNAHEDTDLSTRVNKFGKIQFMRLPVVVSGRRFKGGTFKAVSEYLRVYKSYYGTRRSGAYLEDVR